MLKVEHLFHHYHKKEVLQDVSFTIPAGQIVGLVGKNGAGKSTLMHILATLQQPSSGILSFKNKSYSHVKKIRQHIGFVPQQLAILEDFTVAENMQFFNQFNRPKKSEQQLREICQSVSLDAWQQNGSELSGGMKRKLNLALTLIQSPELLLLDEPTVGIDLRSKLEIQTALLHLSQQGTTIVLISHDMDELTEVTERILHLGEDDYYMQQFAKRGITVERIDQLVKD